MYGFSRILQRLVNAIRTKETLIEGFFSMSNLRAVAQEFAIAYDRILEIERNYALSTARGWYLDKKSEDYGMERRSATRAIGEVVVQGSEGIEIPLGSTLVGGGLRFKTTEATTITGGTATIKIMAVETGAAGNVPAGVILRFDPSVRGVTAVVNEVALRGGTDIETDESLRNRIYQKIRNPITSGNVNHYKYWATSIAGVGKVKVFPIWNGPGTVKVSILGGDGNIATAELVEEVQQYIDPLPEQGAGQAPVGAIVTVSTATRKDITVGANLVIGNNDDITAIIPTIRRVLDRYFRVVSYDDRTTFISYAQIGFLILSVPGVDDYTDLTLNGQMANVPFGPEEVPFLAGTTLNNETDGPYDRESEGHLALPLLDWELVSDGR